MCMRGPEFAHIYRACGLLKHFNRRFDYICEPIQTYFRAVLYREVSWSLTSSTLEQLRSVSISVSDLDRFSCNMSRLSTVEHVQFIVDEVVDHNWDHYNGVSQEIKIQSEARQAEILPAMVQFVRVHTQRFPGRLRTVSCSNGGLWYSLDQKWPEETKSEILRLLPPLTRPTILNSNNVEHITFHLDVTDLSCVRHIRCYRSFSLEAWFTAFRDNRNLLQRCRALKSLEMDTLGPGTFKWAVQEKRSLESRQDISYLDRGRLAYRYLERGLVPLETVHLKEGAGEPLSDELDDITFAFSQTLKNLKFSSFYLPSIPSRSIHLGHGWMGLPAMEHISVFAGRLTVDRHFFKRCPNLKSARLFDGDDQNHRQEITTCLPVDLPQLESLSLVGRCALQFHPVMFHSSPKLRMISMDSRRLGDAGYHSPIDDTALYGSLDLQDNSVEPIISVQVRAAEIVRTLWTWDWYLPNLNHLRLTGEFACQFQFRMLCGCSSLESLDLNNMIVSELPDRILSDADLFMRGSNSSESDDQPTENLPRQAIVAPALRNLRLMGSWTINDSHLSQFLTTMTPNLDCLDTFGLHGFTLKVLADVVRTQPNKIKKVHIGRLESSFEESVVEAGLLQSYHVDSRKDEARVVKIHFEEGMYFVMKDPVPVVQDGSE
ncbi:hypothetical protein BGZ96_000805 [Linnemannia gamsii]|uniref:F-box domain-containing protein n=1 Tax=Linnemannia gamsii TaxID=64522 RepID=A0ABQ7JNR6_9FUNG|nr:hypothetical protein BGZ96_000805 [Linnemannia gamsii]